MGNSIRRVGLLSAVGAGENESFHYQLGRKVSIDLSERQYEKNPSGMWSEKWTMSYTVDLSTCTLTLTRTGKEDEGAKGLLIQLYNVLSEKNGEIAKYGYEFYVQTVTDYDALVTKSCSISVVGTPPMTENSSQIHEGGRVTKSCFKFFGSGDIGSLIVVEKKRKTEQFYGDAVTLAHYFVAGAGFSDFSGNKIDVGLSVVVKIRASNGNLDITVEGPEQHPAFGLRYLFDEAMRTKIWKPSLCPHCATIIQNQRSSMISQCDSDDRNRVPVARRHGGAQKNLRAVDNGGEFNGDGNGNYKEYNIKKYTIFGIRLW